MEGNGKVSLVLCAGLLQVGEDGGNGKGSVVMCAFFVQGGGEEWKWNGFSGDVFWFSAGWGRRRGMQIFQWSCALVCYRVVSTEGNGTVSLVICVGLVQGGGLSEMERGLW
jgi:hypothetical protein